MGCGDWGHHRDGGGPCCHSLRARRMAEQEVASPGRDAHTLCDPATGSAMWGAASTKSPATRVWAFAAGPAETGLGLRDRAPRGILPVAASTYSSLRSSGQNRLQE